MTTLQDEAFEAINGAMYRIGGYEFLGETREGVEAWWHRGTYPRDMRVRVLKSALVEFIEITTTYRGVLGVGEILQNVDCRGSRHAVMQATETAMLRQLEIFRDVIEQTGVAGPNAEAPAPVESTADSAVPDTDEDEADADL